MVKYRLRQRQIISNNPNELIFEDVIDYDAETKSDSEGNYSINITLGLETTDEIRIQFSQQLSVISNNNQTGSEVDLQRKKCYK